MLGTRLPGTRCGLRFADLELSRGEPPAEREISRFPCKKRRHMPGSLTTPGLFDTRVGALEHIAFRYLYSVGARDIPIAAQWLVCALPCRCFTVGLAAVMHGSLPVSRRTENSNSCPPKFDSLELTARE